MKKHKKATQYHAKYCRFCGRKIVKTGSPRVRIYDEESGKPSMVQDYVCSAPMLQKIFGVHDRFSRDLANDN